MKVNHYCHLLENVKLDSDVNLTDARFSVQYVIRPQAAGIARLQGLCRKSDQWHL